MYYARTSAICVCAALVRFHFLVRLSPLGIEFRFTKNTWLPGNFGKKETVAEFFPQSQNSLVMNCHQRNCRGNCSNKKMLGGSSLLYLKIEANDIIG